MTKENFITAQLRESAPYLEDAGFRDTARLLRAAAEEIELLYARLQQAAPDVGVSRADEGPLTDGLRKREAVSR